MALYAKCVTIQIKDMEMVRQMRLHLLGYSHVRNQRSKD